MHLRRTAPARIHSIFQPPVIQNGNCEPISRNQLLFDLNEKGAAKISCRRNVKNSSKFPGAFFFFILAASALIIFMPVASRAQIGTLQNVKLIPRNDTVGVGTIYLLSFEVETELPSDGKIYIHFPAGFDISDVGVASNVDKLDGGFEVERDLDNGKRIVILIRDGRGSPLPADNTGIVKFSIVRNPRTPGIFVFPLVTTEDRSGTLLDQRNFDIDSVMIKPASLDHFTFSPIGPQIANQNIAPACTLTAKDEFDNDVAVNEQIDFSDNTGTLTIKTLPMNGFELDVNGAKITKGQPNVVITAKARTSGKIGMSNPFNVNEIKILRIEAAATTVSQGQTFIPVNMLVQNIGPDTVRLDSAKLLLNSAHYTNIRLIPNSKIPGQGVIRNLIFSVNVNSNALMGSVPINGQIFGTVVPGNLKLSDLGADLPLDAWTVQTPPNLSYVLLSLAPKQVSAGAFFQFKVEIKNSGQATLELNPATTTFQFMDLGQTFIATLDAASGTTVAGNGQKILTFQSTKIPSAIPKGDYAPQVILNGTQNGAPFSRSLTLPNTPLTVGDPPTFQILSVQASQDTVVQGMRKPWSIFLRVKNNTNAEITFDHAELQFYKPGNSNPDAFYRLTLPTRFASDSSRIAANGVDSVVCRIDTTGQLTGVIAIFAKIFVKELPLTPAESNGTQKSILLQTPAVLSLALRTSQATVTAGQTKPWDVIMKVENTGESVARALFESDAVKLGEFTRINLGNDYEVAPPGGDVIIPGNGFKEIIFNVTKTESTPGNSPINLTFPGQVFAKEINSDSVHFAVNTAQILVQPRDTVEVATVGIDSVFNRNPGAIDTVNVGQTFKVKVSVRSTVANAEQVDSVRVSLTSSNQNDFISNNLRTLSGLNGFLTFPVKAGAPAANISKFSAEVVKAYSANTRDWSVQASSETRSVSVYKQAPAQLRVETPTTSVTKVQFGSTQPAWTIDCIVANNAAENSGSAIVIDSSKVTVTINNVPQLDYVIQNGQKPTTLNAGQTDALKYDVVRTGYTGGEATLTVTVFGHDKNTNLLLSSSNLTKITVATSALVKISQTDFAANVNRVAGSEIGLVNTAQKFKIEVTVENNGLEVIDSAYVSLRSSLQSPGASTINPPLAAATMIGTNGDTAKAIFEVTAANLVNAIGETFVARLGRVVAKGAGAAKGANGDTTAVARIELPARLQLSLVTTDGATAFSKEQLFKVRARVKNLGNAQTDRSGRLELTPPQDYRLVNNDPIKNFAAGDSIEWSLQAPTLRVGQQDVFIVKINAQPLDQNSGAPADTANNSARLTVSTQNQVLTIVKKSIIAPAGASDSTISTDQFFTAAVKVQASSNLTRKTIALTLPPGSGYRFVNGDSAIKKIFADTATVRWQLQAPSQENLQPFKLPLEAKAFAGSTTVFSPSDSLLILRNENRAILYLEPGIKETTSQNGLVAVNQNFTIVAKLRNTGRAFVTDTAKVTINVSKTSLTLVDVPGNTAKKFVVFHTGENFKEITWLAKAASEPKLPETITFEITKRPLDVNTGLEVLTSNDPAPFTITTVATGTVAAGRPRITDPPGAHDHVLSTEQQFTVSDTLRWTNAANLVAELILPPNFAVLNNRIQSIANLSDTGKTEISWVVRAPVAAVSGAAFRVFIKGKDSHDATVALADTSETRLIEVVPRAQLVLRAKIAEPLSARDGVLSVLQPFTIVATIDNAGAANLESIAEVILQLPADKDYQLVGAPEDSLRTVTFPGPNTCSWRVLARSSITTGTDLIKVWLRKPPFDQNTNTPASINNAEAALAVRTEGRKLIVTTANQGGGPAIQGQKNFLLMRLLLTNPGASDLKLQMLRFDLRKKKDGTPVEPGAVFENIRVLNEGRLVGDSTNIPTGNSTLQITLHRSDSVKIVPSIPDTVSLFADLRATATGTFRLLFDHGNDFDAIDPEGGGGVAIESADGKQGDKFRLESNSTALQGATDENSFFNYPNPFRPGDNWSNGEGTRFSVPLGVSGELKIVTLLGELVWETKIDSRNLAATAIFWDGRNGAGQRVLNGVYVAVLKTQNGKMLTTKVAVLKR